MRPRIVASVGPLIQLSPTTTTQRGSVPARAVAPFFTGDASFNNQYKLQQSEIRVFYENTSGNCRSKFSKNVECEHVAVRVAIR